MYRKAYLIGDVRLWLESDEPVADADFFPLFRTEDAVPPDYTVRVLRRPLPDVPGKETSNTNHRRTVVFNGIIYRYTNFSDAARLINVPYACAVRQRKEITLWVDYDAPFWDTMLFDALDLPDLFLEKGAGLLHAAFVGIGKTGLLFAGQKGQGKTTQAQLWERFRAAEAINGDRAEVRLTENGLTALGVPLCGSSGVCVNKSASVRAIVFPFRSVRNSVSPLAPMEAFKLLIGCFSYTESDPAMQEKAVILAERIAENAPCLRLECLPDETAVTALSAALGL